MSHTDIHRPLHVLYQDPSMRAHFRESHDHRDGSCDLPEFLDAWLPAGFWRRTRCSVRWWGQDQRICACRRCSQYDAHRRMRRQDRYYIRRDLRTAVAQAAAGELDEDLPLARRPNAW